MKVSKNQVVWARCHLVGLASGIDWTVWSSAESGEAKLTELARTRRNASINASGAASSSGTARATVRLSKAGLPSSGPGSSPAVSRCP